MLEETRDQDVKRMNRLAWAMCAFTLLTIVVVLYGGTIGNWGLAPTLVSGLSLMALAIAAAFEVERLKKKHDILTYAEISAFEKGEEVDRSGAASVRVRKHPLRTAALKTLVAAAFGALLGFAGTYLMSAIMG